MAAIICRGVQPLAEAREDVHALSDMPDTTTVEATFVFAAADAARIHARPTGCVTESLRALLTCGAGTERVVQ